MVCPVTVQELPLAGPGELGPPPPPCSPAHPSACSVSLPGFEIL